MDSSLDLQTQQFLCREFELRLLRCSLSEPSPASSSPHYQSESLLMLIEDVVSSIERGDFLAALCSEGAQMVFPFVRDWEFEDSKACAGRAYEEVGRSLDEFLRIDFVGEFMEEEKRVELVLRSVLVMAIGVAAFLVFSQCNLTGPPSEDFPANRLDFQRPRQTDQSTSGAEWDSWAREQLVIDGTELQGKFSYLQYLVYGKILLAKIEELQKKAWWSTFNGARSNSWWLMRLFVFHQRILEERSPTLSRKLKMLTEEILHNFGSPQITNSYLGRYLCEGEASGVVAAAYLEAGIVEYIYGHADSSRQYFQHSEESCGLQLSVTGALGFRTIHQVDAKAQLVLVSNSVYKESNGHSGFSATRLSSDKNGISYSNGQFEDCEILRAPRLVGNANGGANVHLSSNGDASDSALDDIQQAVVLAQCLVIKGNTPDNDLQKWEMAPYIEAIDAQQTSPFMVRCFCHILRIRWESIRSRTKHRSLLMMENLVQQICGSATLAGNRTQLSFGVNFPTIPALRKEYAELLVSCGMVGEALKIFEDLELWDSLIYCYRLLQKKAAAVDLIKARLLVKPDDPRLWCSLGDVTNNDESFMKALEVSNGKSARAKRSLARSAYNRGDYETATNLWEEAMALNSLYPDGWFALGAAALKVRDFDKAIDGFTRAVQLEPENGEAWNNLACLHMVQKRSKEAFIAFKEALKFRRSSWQCWENYGQVAMDIGNVAQALEAARMILELTHNKKVDASLLERLIVEMESRSASELDEEKGYLQSESPSKETNQYMTALGKILQQCVKSGLGEDIWGLYARWHRLKGDLTMCAEAFLKQVRSYQGSDLWRQKDRFKKFAGASLQLCHAYMDIASSTGSRRELSTAEMHLRSSIKQAVNLIDTAEYRDLQECHNEVVKLLDALTTSS